MTTGFFKNQQREKIAHLHSLFAISDLSSKESYHDLTYIFQNGVERDYNPGEPLFVEGNNMQELIFIRSGRVRISRYMGEGLNITLYVCKAGDFIGEQILNNGLNCSISAHCLENVSASIFSPEQFAGLLRSQPNLGINIICNLAGRINNLTNRIDALSQMRLEDKIFNYLTQLARETGERKGENLILRLGITHAELGCLVGAHRVSVTRAMKKLRSDGHINQKGRLLIVRDPL